MKNRNRVFDVCFFFNIVISAIATSEPPRTTAPKISGVIASEIDDHQVAGAVALVANKGGVVYENSFGMADIAAGKPMKLDSIFWIASMSKPVTAACVLMLQDEGKLSLSDPISKHLPEMSQLKFDGKSVEITIQHLLTHTSGMAEIPSPKTYSFKNLREAAQEYAKVSVQFTPGSKWQYSQTSINTAARIVEVVSGQSFDEFVQQRICQPLGMPDTGFYLTDEQMKRLATSYRRTDAGALEPSPISLLSGHSPTDRDRMPCANGGLFSTAGDYARFCQMLLRDGELDGHRVLTADAVQAMQTLATGELKTGFTAGNGWGIGVCVVRDPEGPTAALSPGSFGHGGAYGTQAWIDPTNKVAYVLMVQRANFPNADASDLRRNFQNAAKQKFVK